MLILNNYLELKRLEIEHVSVKNHMVSNFNLFYIIKLQILSKNVPDWSNSLLKFYKLTDLRLITFNIVLSSI